VAYADFVTAMMALFIVLWIIGQSEAVKQAIAAYFKDPGVFETTRSGGILTGASKSDPLPPKPVPIDSLAADMDRLKVEAGEIEKAIGAMPDFSKFKDKVQVVVTPEGLRIDLMENSEGLFFDIGKATVKPETIKLLKMIATHFAHLPNGIVVEGYTDARPYSSPGYSNWNLSADRANSARTVLEEGGLRSHQVLQVRGFADRNLKVPDQPLDYSNRRVSILVTPTGSNLGPLKPDPSKQPLDSSPPSGASIQPTGAPRTGTDSSLSRSTAPGSGQGLRSPPGQEPSKPSTVTKGGQPLQAVPAAVPKPEQKR
jgi:chemotaxis protein MotB